MERVRSSRIVGSSPSCRKQTPEKTDVGLANPRPAAISASFSRSDHCRLAPSAQMEMRDHSSVCKGACASVVQLLAVPSYTRSRPLLCTWNAAMASGGRAFVKSRSDRAGRT
ncbi:MAG: hypothetical protein EOM10_05625 [Opitutae bacterium]|nr:hypothetical protein [Opitutae bacterium]